MRRMQPNFADLLAPVPRGRVRVFFKGAISTGGDGEALFVEHNGIPGNCRDCSKEFAKGFVEKGLAVYFDPAKAVVKMLKNYGVNGVRVASEYNRHFLSEAKKSDIEQLEVASA